jgi:carbon starvation protein
LAAVILGFLIRKRKASDLASAIIAIDLLIICIILGIFFPIFINKTIWLYILFIYILVSSVIPVWVMSQPRNYLSSFLLIAMMLSAFIGIIFTSPSINLPAFTGFNVNGNFLFPVLFITIACGAISGFHSLVATGAASKQISSEKYMLPISYGSMLVETMVAVLALIAVGSLAVGGKMPTGTPPQIFATAVSGFLNQIGLPLQASYTIVSLAVSSFILTTLDTVARLGRFAFQELFSFDDVEGKDKNIIFRILKSKTAASIFTLLPAYILATMGYQTIWTLFGAANQLLAALTLIACMLFLKKTKRYVYMLIAPTIVMLAVTYTYLILTIRNKIILLIGGGFNPNVDGLQLGIAVLLLILGILVAVSCTKKMLEKSTPQELETVKS